MSKSILTVKGMNGILDIKNKKVEIVREGTMSFLQGLRGTKEIPISKITSIHFKKAGIVSVGHLRILFVGGEQTKNGLFNRSSNTLENTILFDKKQQSNFEKAKKIIEEKMEILDNSQSQEQPPKSGIKDLEKLAELKEKGIITEEEFNAKKKQILDL